MSKTFTEIVDELRELNLWELANELRETVYEEIHCGNKVEVVRCKDCAWLYRYKETFEEEYYTICKCKGSWKDVDELDYCSHGVRRREKDNGEM